MARVFNSSLDYPYSDNWADSLVQLAIYEDGGNADTAGMGGLYQSVEWRVLERRVCVHGYSIHTAILFPTSH